MTPFERLAKLEAQPIPGYSDYYADKSGNIYSCKPWNDSGWIKPIEPRQLKQSIFNGYYHVCLSKNGKAKCVKVHHLIMATFFGERPNGMLALHGAGGRLCNSTNNLYWGTHRQNVDDMRRDGTTPIGEKHPQHRLNELQVRIIRRVYSQRGKTGLHSNQIGRIFGVTGRHILEIVNRIRWSHI